jgi:hypothetical protein
VGSGPGREGEEEEAGWAGVWVGFRVFFLSYFLFFLNTLKLFEFKDQFEFKPYALNQNKTMHQHECTNNFKPRENFNCL